jgi:hypothetical protein
MFLEWDFDMEYLTHLAWLDLSIGSELYETNSNIRLEKGET